MPEITAELAYLFRHALVREAAYSLQLPGDRGRLHELAVRIGLEHWGADDARLAPYAGELALHAIQAIDCGVEAADLRPLKLRLLEVGALDAARRHRVTDALSLYARLAEDPDTTAPARTNACAASARLLLQAGRPVEAATFASRAAQVEGADPGDRVQALTILGSCEIEGGRPAQAEATLREALAQAETLAYPDRLCDALAELGSVLAQTGRRDEAERLLKRAVELGHAGAGDVSLTRACGHLGTLLRNSGRTDESLEFYRRIGGYAARREDQMALTINRANLALIAKMAGRYAEAEQGFYAAQAELRAMGATRTLASLLNIIANYYTDQGRLDAARACFDESIAICREGGMATIQALSEGNRALLLSRTGEYDECVRGFHAAIQLARDSGNANAETTHMSNLSAVLLNIGQKDEAERMMLETVARCRAVGNRRFEQQTLNNLAVAFLDSGRVRRALAIARTSNLLDDPNVDALTRLFAASQHARISLLVGIEPADVSRIFDAHRAPDLPVALLLSFLRTLDVRLRLMADPTPEAARRELAALSEEARKAGVISDKFFEAEFEHLRRLADELIRAGQEGCQPEVFRGFALCDLSASLRLGLLRYMEHEQPAAFEDVRVNPVILKAFRHGTAGVPDPDWSDDRPV